MTSTVPNAVQHTDAQPPITMFGPDFPYAYDDFLAHPADSARYRRPSTAPRWPSSVAGSPASWPRTN